MEMQSHLFLSSYLKVPSLLSSPRKITFSSDLLFCRMVVTDERLQVRRLLIFFQNFPKDVFRKKNVFLWGRNSDAKVVFFLAGSFSRNRAVFEGDGLIRRFFFFFLIFRCWWGNQMFSKSVPILEVIRRTKLMSIFRCVKVTPKSSLFLLRLRCRYL